MDLQRETYYYIPNALAEILECHNGKTLPSILNLFDSKESLIIEKYFNFLTEKELIFWMDSSCGMSQFNFPKLNTTYSFSGTIQSVVFYLDNLTNYNLKTCLEQLNGFGIQFVQLRWNSVTTIAEIEQILSFFHLTGVKSIEVIAPHSEEFTAYSISQFLTKPLSNRLSKMVFYSAPENAVISHANAGLQSIISIQKDVDISIEKLNQKDFVINTDFYLESLNFNPYYNLKLLIDSSGYIKHDNHSENNFGSVNEGALESVLNNTEYTGLWNIRKDDCSICNTCEHRNICPDRRIPTRQENNGMWKFEEMCPYNPEIGTWVD